MQARSRAPCGLRTSYTVTLLAYACAANTTKATATPFMTLDAMQRVDRS